MFRINLKNESVVDLIYSEYLYIYPCCNNDKHYDKCKYVGLNSRAELLPWVISVANLRVNQEECKKDNLD